MAHIANTEGASEGIKRDQFLFSLRPSCVFLVKYHLSFKKLPLAGKRGVHLSLELTFYSALTFSVSVWDCTILISLVITMQHSVESRLGSLVHGRSM